MIRRDNYQLQLEQAKKHFLTYDQQELIHRCRLQYDEKYFYVRMLSFLYRICRTTGDMQYLEQASWKDGNSFGEVMTLLDWLCDSKKDRYISGNWVNLISHGNYFHRELQEEEDPDAVLFEAHQEAFCAACEALQGERIDSGDLSYAIELVDGLKILVQLWFGDEEFPPRLRFLWDENALRYLRYETTWYALGLLRKQLRTAMKQ